MTKSRTAPRPDAAIDASWFEADLRDTSDAWRLMYADEAIASGDFRGDELDLADLLAGGWPRHASALLSAAWWVAEALWRNGVATSVLNPSHMRRARQIGLAVVATTLPGSPPRPPEAAWMASELFDEPSRTTIRLQLPRTPTFDGGGLHRSVESARALPGIEARRPCAQRAGRDMTTFPRIELDEGARSTLPAGSFDVVRSGDLAKAEQERRLITEAWIQADRIVADAHEQAAADIALARANIALANAAWMVEQARIFEARTADAIDLLCRTTGQVAEAVIAAIFERMPALPIQASVDIAVRLLRSEMRSHVLCHALDFEAVGAAAASLGAAQMQTDDAVMRGELIFRDAQGEVRIDGTDAVLQLLADWKTALSIALPAPAQSAPTHSPVFSERPAAVIPSTTESEKTP